MRCDAIDATEAMQGEAILVKMMLSKLGLKLVLCDNSYLKGRQRDKWVKEVCEQRDVLGEYHHRFPVLRRNEKRFFSLHKDVSGNI